MRVDTLGYTHEILGFGSYVMWLLLCKKLGFFAPTKKLFLDPRDT